MSRFASLLQLLGVVLIVGAAFVAAPLAGVVALGAAVFALGWAVDR